MIGRRSVVVIAVSIAVAVAVAGPARALAGSCTVDSVSPVAFGGYDVFDPAPLDSTGSITIDCSDVGPADSVRVELDAGASGSFAARTLMAGAAELAYNLYLDAARTMVWGDGSGGTSTYGPVQPAPGPATITIYGRVPARQDAAAGSYDDTIIVTLQY